MKKSGKANIIQVDLVARFANATVVIVRGTLEGKKMRYLEVGVIKLDKKGIGSIKTLTSLNQASEFQIKFNGKVVITFKAKAKS